MTVVRTLRARISTAQGIEHYRKITPVSLLDQLLTERRSIRKYRAEIPPETLIEQALGAAANAPSSSNRQPVRFVRIASPIIKKALQEAIEEARRHYLRLAAASEKPKKVSNWINTYYRYSAFMFSAPVLIAVGTVTDQPSFPGTLAEAGIIPPDALKDRDPDITIGLTLEAILLKGQELGLASCLLTAPLAFISPVEKIIGTEDIEIKCFLTLGYPAERPSAPPRKPLLEIYREV